MKRALSRMGLLGVFLMFAALGQIVLSSSVYAAENPTFDWDASYVDGNKLGEKQLDWCFSNLSGESTADIASYRSGTGGRYVAECLDSSKSGPCKIVEKGSDEEFSCIHTVAEDDPLYQAIKAAEVNEIIPLQELVCGTASNPQQAETRITCYGKVKDIYFSDKCRFSNGTDNKNGYTSAKYAAECVYPTIRGLNRSVTLNDVKNAIRKGKKVATTEIAAATKEDVKRENCESSGGEWKDSKCIEASESTTTCAIEGMGWLICPAVRIIAVFNDALFGMINNLLDINPSLFEREGRGAAIFNAWEAVRNIANVAFVIAFLVIIYSQITGVGLSNYGIKKMLPRMFIAAILVNSSYIVCALAVDLSNILGTSLHDLMIDQTKNMGDTAGTNLDMWDGLMTFLIGGGVGALAVGAGVITVGAYGFMATLALLVPLAIAALLAALTVLFILVAREAFIIILVALSPLAFVAYLLPNTEQWFSRWRKTFFSMLLIYPLVAMLFGGSQLASAVIRAGAEDALTYILSLVVLVMPLFATPLLLKFSGGLIGRVAGMMNNPNKGPFDRMKKASASYANREKGFRTGDNIKRTNAWRDGSRGKSAIFGGAGSKRRKTATWLSGIGGANAVESKEKNKYGEIASTAAGRDYIAKRAYDDPEFAKSLAGGNAAMIPDIQAYSKQAVHEEAVKDVKAQRVLISHADINELLARMQNASAPVAERAAAAQEIAERGGHQHVQEAYDYLMTEGKAGGMNIEKVQELSAEALLRRKPAGVSATTANGMKSGTMTGDGFMNEFKDRIEVGKFSAEDIAKMDLDDHIRIAQMAANNDLSDGALIQLEAQLQEIKGSDTMKLSPEQTKILEEATQRRIANRPNGSQYGLRVDLPIRPTP